MFRHATVLVLSLGFFNTIQYNHVATSLKKHSFSVEFLPATDQHMLQTVYLFCSLAIIASDRDAQHSAELFGGSSGALLIHQRGRNAMPHRAGSIRVWTADMMDNEQEFEVDPRAALNLTIAAMEQHRGLLTVCITTIVAVVTPPAC